MLRAALRAALLGAALLAIAPAAAPAATTTPESGLRPCPREKGFDCETLTVPLDRGGAVGGTIPLHFAIQPGTSKDIVVALTGGPGQNGIPFGSTFAEELAPVLRGRRLLVLDQRGTGRSNILSCPEVQGLDGLQIMFGETVASCARRLGAQRDHYSTVDTADDIEAIRRVLGVDKLTFYGVSYGTWVEQQYARRYPTHVRRLVLDSVVAPGNDPYDLQTTEALPRVLRGLCDGGACAGITKDPFADLTAVVQGIQRTGSLRGVIRDNQGGRRTVALSQYDLLEALVASDLNPWLRVRIPAALAAARAGDAVPLLRLRRDVSGPPTGLGDLSAGLFVATTCADAPLPYGLSSPLAERPALSAAALAAVPARDVAPFDRATIDISSAPEICMQWPQGAPAPPVTGPLPDVPTLVLSGRSDLRTPEEGARAVTGEIPGATLVPVSGVGHDVLGSDETGCAIIALSRFFQDKPVGSPCRGKTSAIPLAPIPPRSLRQVPRATGIPGVRGQVAYAAVATIGDARTTVNESVYAGWDDAGAGGLRSGRYDDLPTGAGDLLVFHADVYVPGVSVTGSIFSSEGDFTGKIDVVAGRWSGVLHLAHGNLRGTLGGQTVRASAHALATARVARAAPPGMRPVLPIPLPPA